MKKGKIIILSLVGLLLVAGIIAIVSKKGSGEQVNFQTTAVGPGDIATNITATGTIDPVNTVDVGIQVSGIVSAARSLPNWTAPICRAISRRPRPVCVRPRSTWITRRRTMPAMPNSSRRTW